MRVILLYAKLVPLCIDIARFTEILNKYEVKHVYGSKSII